MTGQELTAFQRASLDDRWRYAQAIAQAGNLVPPGLREPNGDMNPGKVLMVMEQATALGFHPMVGVNNINIIDGKISLPPALMQAAIRNAGHALRIRKTGTIEGGDFAVTAVLKRADDDWEFEATWTPQRAARAGLCSYERDVRSGVWEVRAQARSGKALPWQSYTEAMCKARAISEVCMEGATDVLMGAVYTPEELGATVDAGGVVIDHAPAGEPVNADRQVAAPSMPDPAPSAPSAPRTSSAPNASEPIDAEVVEEDRDWQAKINAAATADDVRVLWYAAQDAGQFAVQVGDLTLKEAIERRGALLREQEAAGVIQAELDADVVDGEGTGTPENGPQAAAGADEGRPAVLDAPRPAQGDSAADEADAGWLAGHGANRS